MTLFHSRLWWENTDIFTVEQKESLRETSLARIICDNTGITEVPEKPFQYRPRESGYTHCNKLPAFDLGPWKEGELMPCLIQLIDTIQCQQQIFRK